MDVAQVTAAAVASLGPALPYLLKTGEKIAEDAIEALGERAWNCAKAVWERLRPNLDTHAQKAAERVATAPDDEDARGALRIELKDILAVHDDLAESLASLLQSTGQTNVSVIASGANSVAVGRDASGATIVTGDSNAFGRG